MSDESWEKLEHWHNSRIPKFYKLSMEERVKKLAEYFDLIPEEVKALRSQGALDLSQADKMIENTIGIYSLPIGVGLNFIINGKDYVIPMATEEPSVVAAVSLAAKLTRQSGGFKTESDPPLMIGQIQVINIPNITEAAMKLEEAKDEILAEANKVDPCLVELGGGAKDIEIRILPLPSPYYEFMLVFHIIVDTRDAMGANAVNGMAEAVAPLVEKITGGKVFLRILSNLADRRLARAWVEIPVSHFAFKEYEGIDVARGIEYAYLFAAADPYRAATHNKGIMNGIDAVLIATGNDWRAVEAGVHAYAAKSGQYSPVTQWEIRDDKLYGSIEIPLAVGIVGGSTSHHPMAKIMLKFLRVKTSQQFSQVLAAVGLAQNLAALRALATDGIQQGHMNLHAKSVALSAGAKGDMVDRVAQELIRLGDIKINRAKDVLGKLKSEDAEG